MSLAASLLLICLTSGAALASGADHFSGKVASVDPATRPEGAHLTLSTALSIAERVASASGFPAATFAAWQFAYHCQDGKRCEWAIFYVGKVFIRNGQRAQPSIRPIVIVDDETSDAHLLAPPPLVDVK